MPTGQRGGRGLADTDGECECDDGETEQQSRRVVGSPPPIRRATWWVVASPAASRERQGQVRNHDLVRQARQCRAHTGAPSCARTCAGNLVVPDRHSSIYLEKAVRMGG